jgi:hypothetical protein
MWWSMSDNPIKAGTAVLKRSYRSWSIEMEGTAFPRFVAEGSWCFFGEGQTLLQILNRMNAQEVNAFVDDGRLTQYLKEHMVRGPEKNKRDRGFKAW